MTKKNNNNAILNLLREDPRYRIEAYQFVSEALAVAQDSMRQNAAPPTRPGAGASRRRERHLTGQELCEAIRELAIQRFGYMAASVLRHWGVTQTADFGEIVYNMIRIGEMKKSPEDRREDFDNVYDFDEVFRKEFRMCHAPRSESE